MELKLNNNIEVTKSSKVVTENREDFIQVINPTNVKEKMDEETMSDGEIWEMNLMYGIGNDVY